jgi:predicted glycosyltransferase
VGKTCLRDRLDWRERSDLIIGGGEFGEPQIHTSAASGPLHANLRDWLALTATGPAPPQKKRAIFCTVSYRRCPAEVNQPLV